MFVTFQRHVDYHILFAWKLNQLFCGKMFTTGIYILSFKYTCSWNVGGGGGGRNIALMLYWNFSMSWTNSTNMQNLASELQCMRKETSKIFQITVTYWIVPSQEYIRATSICPSQLIPTEKPNVPVATVFCAIPTGSFYSSSGRMVKGMKNIMCNPETTEWWWAP